MSLRRKGSLWKWFWIFVILMGLGIGLYFLLKNSIDVNKITDVGAVPKAILGILN